MSDNYTGKHWSTAPRSGDEIDELVNHQLLRGRNGGIHGSGPDLCPNPEHESTWHGTVRAITQRWSGTRIGTCPGSYFFNPDGSLRDTGPA